MKTLFLAWRDPETTLWSPIGRLTLDRGVFRFVYTHGVKRAKEQPAFEPLVSFPELDKAYESDELFPIFANRLLPSVRPDYKEFLEYLGVEDTEDDKLSLLGISGGRRVTDSYEVFLLPEADMDGNYRIKFFAHGLRHLTDESRNRINELAVGEQLLLVLDFQNPHDHHAIMLRTNDTNVKFKGDRYFVGYCPRYLLKDVHKALEHDANSVRVVVAQINHPPAPLQLRLRCRMTVQWPTDYYPFASNSFEPLVD